jgi:hypothetical protein
METNGQQIAQTILAQMGGNRFIAMTGARNLMHTKNGLVFNLPRGAAKNGATHVQIILDESDTYTVSFGKMKNRVEYVEIEELSGVHWDSLQRHFTRVTGLDCTL